MGEIVRKCYKCEIEKLIEQFYFGKDSQKYRNECIQCRNIKQKEYESENSAKIKEYKKQYFQHNKNKINESRKIYFINKRKTDVNFRLICNTRRRIHHALNDKSNSSSTLEILGIDIETYKKWIEFRRTPDMTWDNIEIDHVKAICMLDVSKDEELREAFNWKNTQPLLKEVHQQKGIKFNFLDYQNQFIKAYQFIK